MPAKKRAAAPARKKPAASARAPRSRRSSPHPAPVASTPELAEITRSLARVAESLHFAHESFAHALLRLPRAEDYEPLTETLRRLAEATPGLLRSLEGKASPAHDLGLPGLVEAAFERPAPSRPPEGVGEAIASARRLLEAALESLPGPADYEPAARNLREMATVSPSLLDWLGEVPPLSAPLADSVAGLRQALQELERAQDALGGPPRPPAADRVKVVVRG